MRGIDEVLDINKFAHGTRRDGNLYSIGSSLSPNSPSKNCCHDQKYNYQLFHVFTPLFLIEIP